MREQMGPTDQVTEHSRHITVNERAPSERFHRFVEEKVRDWMRDHEIDESAADYEVAFFDEEALNEISCLVVVHAGGQLYRAWEEADNPRLALRRSLDNLKIEDEPEAVGETPLEVVDPVTH